MLTFRPQGGTSLSRDLADAYQARVPAGSSAGAMAAQVVRAVYGSRRPITGRQLQQLTGYSAAPEGFRTAAECARLAAQIFPKPAAARLPAWLDDDTRAWPPTPAWVTNHTTAR